MVRGKLLFILPFMLILTLFIGSSSFASTSNVYDQASLFSLSQKEEMEQQIDLLSTKLQVDIIIVTTHDDQGKTSHEYAHDFYEEQGFGYGETLDGILFLLNMDEREVYIYTMDLMTDYFSNDRIEEVLDQVYPYLIDEKYGESVHVFLTEVERIMEAGVDHYFAEDGSDQDVAIVEDSSVVNELMTYFFVSIAIGGVSVGIMSLSNKGRSSVNEGTYLEQNSFHVTSRSDRHYNTTVTQQKIERNTSNGGSGGGPRGGGAGGGGRSF